MKKLIVLAAVSALMLLCVQMAGAQNSRSQKKAEKAAGIKKLIDNGKYVFRANFAIPMSGGSRQLTDMYDLRVTRDSVIAFLPYFGRAYLAPSPAETEGGIKFAIADFSYSKQVKKNGNWDIVIKPKKTNLTDWRDVQQLRLSISQSGYASLQVTSSNRDPISFEGDIVDKD